MRYKLSTDVLVNRLVPHFLSGRRYILLLQSLLYPLQTLNDRFVKYAREKKIEANVTSQVMYFEWYLTRKFRHYFVNELETIHIKGSEPVGVDIYYEASPYQKAFTLWFNNELINTINPEEEPRALFFPSEEKSVNKVSFMVCVPEITISETEFVYMLSYVVNNYRIAGKTYLIKINSKELNPIRN